MSKKPKFFNPVQPYEKVLICLKCQNKNDNNNKTMIDGLRSRTKEVISDEEKKNIDLSPMVAYELREALTENKEAVKTINTLTTCDDKEKIVRFLHGLDLSENAIKELTNHFYTVGQINKRAKQRIRVEKSQALADKLNRENREKQNKNYYIYES
jgi:hypothetical protein